MNQKSIYVHLLSLLFCLIAPLSTAIGAPNELTVPNPAIPEITPGELLIRVTPAAHTDFERRHANAEIALLHSTMKVQSFHRLFPRLAYPRLNPNLERIYLLRFPIASDLNALKAAYSAHPLIEAVEFNYLRPTLASEIIPNDPQFAEQWNLPLISVPQAWAIEKGDPNVIMAIVDGGIDYNHEDLASKVWTNIAEIPDNGIDDDGNGYIDDIRGWDFTDAPNVAGQGDFLDGDNDPLDEGGHGTHIAGIAGAAVDNGVGVAGIAWNCTLMPVRASLSIGGGSSLQDDDSSSAIIYAVDNGAKIINMSWGSKRSSFVIRDVLDYAYARGVLMVAAAGNDHANEIIFPAGYRKVIAVASTEQNKQRFYQSNAGASVDIGAPGNVIVSTHIRNRYRPLTGTSMATPHVVGVAALVMSKRPSLTHEEVRQILISTADPITESPRLVGAGNLNAERALMASGSLQARIFSPETNSGGSDKIEIIGTAGGFKFDTWQLQYGQSTTPATWTPINPPSQQQKVNEGLLVWDTSAVPEEIYTIRLEVIGKDGAVLHDKVVVSVDRSPPQIRNIRASEQLFGSGSITVFTWSTDDFSIDTLNRRIRGRLAPFSPISETSASTEHFFSVSLGPGQYDFFVTSRNAVGLETVDNNNGQFYHVDVAGESISPNGFVGKQVGLSPMHLGSVTADFDRDGQGEIVGLPLAGDLVSGVETYERDASGVYQLQHTGDVVFNPSAVDDTDGDGLLEILGSDEDRTLLLESLTQNGYPEKIVWESPFLAGGLIADLDRDGRKELIGPDNNNDRILVFENRGNDTYEEIIALTNDTEGSNVFAEQLVVGDFDGDGRMELMAGDSEGELFIYESAGNDQLVETWRWNPGDASEVPEVVQLAAGDLTGDGIPEFVVGSAVSETALPSLRPRWRYTVFSTSGDNRYAPLWWKEILPYRLRGNSVAIGDVDGEAGNELVVFTNPSLYIFKTRSELGQPIEFTPIWYQAAWETPRLLIADLNSDGFSEFYVNDHANLVAFEVARAVASNSVASIQPWGLSAAPLTERVVRVAWQAPEAATVFTVYRAIGTSDEPPAPSEFQVHVENLDVPGLLDRRITKDTTYWYAVTATGDTGVETERTEPVSVTPRTPPKMTAAEYIQSNQVVVTFDKRMGDAVGNASRYLLREPDLIAGINPASAVRDRMGSRAVLTFRAGDLVPGRTYELTVSSVQDIDRNPIDLRASTQMLNIPAETESAELKDFTRTIVYPNPVRPNQSHKGAVIFDRLPTDTTIELYAPNGQRLDILTVTLSDRGRKEWLLLSNGTSEVTSGVYIYVMEFDGLKQVGKIAVIK